MENQRRSPRLRYRSYGTITDGQSKWPVHIINISTHGALIAVICKHTLAEEKIISLQIELLDGTSLFMHGTIAHMKEHYIGIDCEPKGKMGKDRLANALELRDSPYDDGQHNDDSNQEIHIPSSDDSAN